MEVKVVRKRVAAIKAQAGDDEVAHCQEDDLYVDVLMAVAKGADNAPALARAALRTQKIAFSRWCA